MRLVSPTDGVARTYLTAGALATAHLTIVSERPPLAKPHRIAMDLSPSVPIVSPTISNSLGCRVLFLCDPGSWQPSTAHRVQVCGGLARALGFAAQTCDAASPRCV